MRDPVLVVWGILLIVGGIWLKWCLKRYGRTLDSRATMHIVILMLTSSLAGLILQLGLKDSIHTLWVSRLFLLTAGILHAWSLFRLPLAKRDTTSYERDSIATEAAFTLVLGLGASICFTASPRLLSLVKIARVEPGVALWDAPVLLLMPLLLLKLSDLAGQVPFRYVERNWVYPIEPVNVENWPWRDLVRLNFRIATSLTEEYRLFSSKADPWIEIPREAKLGNVFRLMIQERQKKQGLKTIQDMGPEYEGDPRFWWLFKVKFIWWRPSSWKREQRYLDPDSTVAANDIRNDDVILAMRVPADKAMLLLSSYRQDRVTSADDAEKTVIIGR